MSKPEAVLTARLGLRSMQGSELRSFRIWASIGLLFLLAVFFGCSALSPVSRPTVETRPGPITAGEGSRITTVTIQTIAGKAGWAATPIALWGWIVMTIRAKRRLNAADELIRSIEQVGSAAKLVKSQVRNKGNSWIDRRVAKLSELHGWGAHGKD